MNNIKNVNEDPDFREYMTAEEDNKKIMNSLKSEAYEHGVEQGIERGIEQATINNALSFLKNGVSLELVSKSTGLSIERLIELKEQTS